MRKPTWFPWPPVMIIFLTNVLLGCFGYFALRTVLVLFLKRVLGFSETGATKVYHAYAWLACFTPIGAAIIADSISGKWKTLIWAGLIYVAGKFLLTVSAVPAVGDSAVALGILALVLMAFAAGGGAACTNALVGDQFKLPEQSHGMALYYSFAYWLANVTIFASIFVAPKFREVQCFDQDCYALNFSIATVLTLMTTCLLFVGKRWFVIKAPAGNVVVEVTKCIAHAISRKRSLTEQVAKKHWLDYADDKFDLQLIKDIKQLLQLCILFIPLPLYWALFEQQGSRWTFQATRLTGEVNDRWQILPDQTQLLNPLFVVFLIPLFDYCMYPILNKLNVLKKPLQRMTFGGLLSAISFVFSAILELQIQAEYPVGLRANETSLHFLNSAPCPLHLEFVPVLNFTSLPNLLLEPGEIKSFNTTIPGSYDLKVKSNSGACSFDKMFANITAPSTYAITHLLFENSNKTLQLLSSEENKMTKSANGSALIMFFYSGLSTLDTEIFLEGTVSKEIHLPNRVSGRTKFISLPSYPYSVILKPSNVTLGKFYPRTEGIYVVNVNDKTMQEYTLVKPNTVHMLWIIPQYVAITVSEVLFSVTSINFTYSQAPESMKAVVQAAWLMAVAFGNLVILIIAQANFFNDDVAKEFFLFAVLMAATMLVFAVLAWRFKPIDLPKKDDPTTEFSMTQKVNYLRGNKDDLGD